jgi:hypothetical protein
MHISEKEEPNKAEVAPLEQVKVLATHKIKRCRHDNQQAKKPQYTSHVNTFRHAFAKVVEQVVGKQDEVQKDNTNREPSEKSMVQDHVIER